MITVDIKIHPEGDMSRSRMLGTMVIANDGTGSIDYGNYDVVLSHSGRYYGKRKEPWKIGRINGHYRELSPYHLVFRAIKDTLKL